MIYGNKPADGGALIIEDTDYQKFVEEAPAAIKFIKPLLGATDDIMRLGRMEEILFVCAECPYRCKKRGIKCLFPLPYAVCNCSAIWL